MRVGNFTSSEIGALMANGKKEGSLGVPALTYIAECNMERRLGRALENDANARPAQWGTLTEQHVFKSLGIDYSIISKNSIQHPEYEFWVGTPDSICYEPNDDESPTAVIKTVVDIKCPFTLKSYCQLVDAWNAGGIQGIRAAHKDGDKFYWQLVSNAILTDCNYAELIVYCPYREELPAIRTLAQRDDYIWIYYAQDSELPWLYNGGYYSNINKFRFEIPKEDKLRLTERVLIAAEQLVIPVLVNS